MVLAPEVRIFKIFIPLQVCTWNGKKRSIRQSEVYVFLKYGRCHACKNSNKGKERQGQVGVKVEGTHRRCQRAG
jgi:hypothetical protein